MTFGERLKLEREARGVGLEEIAAATKIQRRFLEALERDDFETLPGDVFTKGYVRAFAQVIGADADVLVAEFVAQRGLRAEPSGGGADDPVLREMSRVLKVGRSTRSPVRRGAAVAVSGGVIAVAVLAWLGFGLFPGA